MEDYGLGLALFDYLPVLLSAAGLYLLADLLTRALPASRALLLLGFALVIAGGLSKATWKLIWVLGQVNLVVLDSLLFVCMAPGMVLLALHTAAAASRWRGGTGTARPGRNSLVVILPVLVAAAGLAAGQPGGRAWFFLLLATSSLSNIVMTALLMRLSWGWEQRLTAGIFLASMMLTLSLSWLARTSAGSLPLQWLAESVNLFATGAFALAVWRLRSHYLQGESRGTGAASRCAAPGRRASPAEARS